MIAYDQILEFILKGGTASAPLLLLFVYGLYKEWWFMGKPVRELRNERDAWRRIALKSTNIADRAFLQIQQPRDGETTDAQG